jgi:hypothetical protein
MSLRCLVCRTSCGGAVRVLFRPATCWGKGPTVGALSAQHCLQHPQQWTSIPQTRLHGRSGLRGGRSAPKRGSFRHTWLPIKALAPLEAEGTVQRCHQLWAVLMLLCEQL